MATGTRFYELLQPQRGILGRVIDANLNRLKEGLRVVEDICRYGYDDADMSSKIKHLRHKAKIDQSPYLEFRSVNTDVLKTSLELELDRSDLASVMIANLKRSEESARVLEECFKLFDTTLSELFKSIRYELYDIEKNLTLNLNLFEYNPS